MNLSEEQKINRTLELIETSKQIFLVKQELKQKRSDPNKVLTGDQKSELFLLTDGIEITQSKVLSGITATMQEGFNKGTAKFVVENAEAIGMLLYDTSIVQLVDKDAVARNRARVEGIAYLVTHLDELPEQIATDFKNDLKAAKQKIDAGDLEGGMKIFGELTANLYSSVLNTGAGALKLSAGITKAIGKVGNSISKTLPTGRQQLDPTTVSFSQATVAYQKAGSDFNYDDLVTTMKKNGWQGDPVDVVKMKDGLPTSADNTRILAAREAGIKIEANLRNYDDPISANMAKRFKFDGQSPKTWGEAIEFRIKKQSQMKGTDPNWLNQYPNGSIYDPDITGKP